MVGEVGLEPNARYQSQVEALWNMQMTVSLLGPMCLLGSVDFVSRSAADLTRIYAALRDLLQAASDNPADFTATLFSFRSVGFRVHCVTR